MPERVPDRLRAAQVVAFRGSIQSLQLLDGQTHRNLTDCPQCAYCLTPTFGPRSATRLRSPIWATSSARRLRSCARRQARCSSRTTSVIGGTDGRRSDRSRREVHYGVGLEAGGGVAAAAVPLRRASRAAFMAAHCAGWTQSICTASSIISATSFSSSTENAIPRARCRPRRAEPRACCHMYFAVPRVASAFRAGTNSQGPAETVRQCPCTSAAIRATGLFDLLISQRLRPFLRPLAGSQKKRSSRSLAEGAFALVMAEVARFELAIGLTPKPT